MKKAAKIVTCDITIVPSQIGFGDMLRHYQTETRDDAAAGHGGLRKVTYRLYPSKTEKTAMFGRLRHHQQLYNAATQERIDAWKKSKISISYVDQCSSLTELRQSGKEWQDCNCSSEQITLRRVDKAFAAFFRRCKAGQTPGFPRFKSLKRFPGFGYKSHGDGWRFTPGANWKHGKLRLSGIGTIKARGEARQGGTIKSCELMYTDGVWELSLTLDCPVIERKSGTGAMAYDWGVESFATLAIQKDDAAVIEKVENPRWFQAAKDTLKALDQSVSRKKRGSKRRGKVIKRRAKARSHIARRRKDWQHKLSAEWIGRFGLIADEALTVKNMTHSAKGTVEEPGKNVAQKAGLNREILDTAPSQFRALVAYKAVEADTLRMIAPTRTLKPSQRCCECWSAKKKTLSERTHVCPVCGHTEPRDDNSAKVVLKWALTKLAETYVGQELAAAA